MHKFSIVNIVEIVCSVLTSLYGHSMVMHVGRTVVLHGCQHDALKNFSATVLGLVLCYPMFSRSNCIAMVHMN